MRRPSLAAYQLAGGIRGVLVASGLALALACGGAGRCGHSGSGVNPGGASTGAAGTAGTAGRPHLGDLSQLTDEKADALAAWLVPYVERAGGATFTTRPVGRLGTPDALAGILASESKDILSRIYDLPPDILERMSKEERGSVPGLLGKYATSTGAVYIVPDNVASMGASLGDDTSAEQVAILIMAHELGHALQDQVGDLDHVFNRLEDLDRFDALAGITEGHANWITLRVARELDMEDAFWILSASQGWNKDGLQQPRAFDIWMRYGQGMAFCEHHAAQGGTDRLWEIIHTPPRSSTMIFRPERYGQPDRRPAGVGASLAGVEQALTKTPHWAVADTNLGEAVLRKETLGLPQDRVDRVLAPVVWGHERRLFVPAAASVSPRNATLMLVQFEEASQAREFVTLMSDGLEAQADARTQQEQELAANFPGVQPRTWIVEAAPYDRVKGDVVVRRIVGPLTAEGSRGVTDEEQSLWVVRDNLLVVVGVSGFRPGNRLDKAVDQLFAQVEAADLGTQKPEEPGSP